MDSEALWQAIDAQRGAFADRLDALTPEQWEAASLCVGWTVRDVAVHVTQSQASAASFLNAALRSGFRFDSMIYQSAKRDDADPAVIVRRLRAMSGSRRRPPLTTEVDPLMDILVHAQDVCVPLGIDHPMPASAAVVVGERLWHMRFPLNPRRRWPDIQFVATDADAAFGTGRTVQGPIRDIVMALAGRPSALDSQLSAGAAPASGSGPGSPGVRPSRRDRGARPAR